MLIESAKRRKLRVDKQQNGSHSERPSGKSSSSRSDVVAVKSESVSAKYQSNNVGRKNLSKYTDSSNSTSKLVAEPGNNAKRRKIDIEEKSKRSLKSPARGDSSSFASQLSSNNGSKVRDKSSAIAKPQLTNAGQNKPRKPPSLESNSNTSSSSKDSLWNPLLKRRKVNSKNPAVLGNVSYFPMEFTPAGKSRKPKAPPSSTSSSESSNSSAPFPRTTTASKEGVFSKLSQPGSNLTDPMNSKNSSNTAASSSTSSSSASDALHSSSSARQSSSSAPYPRASASTSASASVAPHSVSKVRLPYNRSPLSQSSGSILQETASSPQRHSTGSFSKKPQSSTASSSQRHSIGSSSKKPQSSVASERSSAPFPRTPPRDKHSKAGPKTPTSKRQSLSQDSNSKSPKLSQPSIDEAFRNQSTPLHGKVDRGRGFSSPNTSKSSPSKGVSMPRRKQGDTEKSDSSKGARRTAILDLTEGDSDCDVVEVSCDKRARDDDREVKSGSKSHVKCPICQASVPHWFINSHLDQCVVKLST